MSGGKGVWHFCNIPAGLLMLDSLPDCPGRWGVWQRKGQELLSAQVERAAEPGLVTDLMPSHRAVTVYQIGT